MKLTIFPFVAYLLGSATAQPECKNLTIPVSISARNGNFSESVTPTTDIETTNFFLKLARAHSNYTEQVLQGVCFVYLTMLTFD